MSENTAGMHKVIFSCLGPNKQYTATDNKQYSDGDVALLNEEDYIKSVTECKFAQNWNEELEIKVKRLVDVADKKRKEILEKMSKIKSL